MQAIVGAALIGYGAGQGTLFGLCLTMLGTLPLVAGISNEYSVDLRGTAGVGRTGANRRQQHS